MYKSNQYNIPDSMVKIKNKHGDFKKGRQGRGVYQGFYGKQIRRKHEGEKKNKSPKQLEVQQRFREGLAFAESLSEVEKLTIINYIETRGLKLTWHNYAKLISMAPVKVDRSNLQIPGIVTFPSALQAWRYRNTINMTEITGISKTNFPVLIEIQGNDPSGTNYVDFSLVKSGGDDIRFTRSDGETMLSYWIESWDAAGKVAQIWVKMDSLPAQETVPIFLYYNNVMALQASDLAGALYS